MARSIRNVSGAAFPLRTGTGLGDNGEITFYFIFIHPLKVFMMDFFINLKIIYERKRKMQWLVSITSVG